MTGQARTQQISVRKERRRAKPRGDDGESRGYRDRHAAEPSRMIGLSVAVGRFVEALFWAILKIAGSVAALAVAGVVALVAVGLLIHRAWTRRR